MGHFGPLTGLLGTLRRRYPRAFRIGFWHSLGAISLTLPWLATVGLAPDVGLTRSYWYPVNASTEPIIDERITAIDLAFIDERTPADPELPGSLGGCVVLAASRTR